MVKEIPGEVISKAQAWLDSPAVDETSKNEIRSMMEHDQKALIESFYSDLEFGTGGLRGIMGVGSMRMNKFTVGMATQGFANYILQQFSGLQCSVAIAHDSRNQSRFFAETTAAVLSANGIRVHLFSDLRPTPLLSFAVRHLGCQAGVVITASHNPKEYNGYKAYWNDGAQVLPPHDKGIITEVRKVQRIDDVRFTAKPELISAIGPEVEEAYLNNLKGIIHSGDAIRKAEKLSIVYTSIHGAGITMVPRALNELGFRNIHIVEEQAIPDGNFSTVESPNPEEKEALNMALSLAEKTGSDMVLGTDPDTDRVGMAIRNPQGKMVLLNGNQAACLIVDYQLRMLRDSGKLRANHYIAKTIVTTDLLESIARHYGVKWYDTLTGFKYIAGVIREKEGREEFVAGGEESYGYSVGEFVRDKDAVLSSVVICEIAAWCASQNMSMWNYLMDIYSRCGLYHEALVSVTMKGLDGLRQIQEKMSELRSSPPASLGGSKVTGLRDIQEGTHRDLTTGSVQQLDLPKSNVLQFILEDGSKISARPSGTEPKIKFYFSLRDTFRGADAYADQVAALERRIHAIRQEIGL